MTKEEKQRLIDDWCKSGVIPGQFTGPKLNVKASLLDEPSKEGIVKAHAAVFGNIDLVDDIIERGAFKRTIKDTGGIWPVLKDHYHSQKIGFNLKADEDDKGLVIEEQLALDVQMAKEVFALTLLAHKVGGKDAMSIGFFPIKAVPDKERPQVRRLKEIKMVEHSHVTFGANEEAYSVAAKAWESGDDLGLGDYVENFYGHMEAIGFKVKDINDALKSAASAKIDPQERILQSISRAISTLKQGAF